MPLAGRVTLPSRTVVIDVLLVFTVTVIAIAAVVALVFPVPRYAFVAAVSGLTLIAIGSLVARFITRPDHLQARQSHQTLAIANETITHLRQGLSPETAQAVCRLILERTEAAAVAITDTESVLGFSGIGEDHHHTGGPLLTRATRDALVANEHKILRSREEIGCTRRDCLLKAAIIVPLEMRGSPAGTLKFYYTTPRLLNETQVAMVEGLALLLSTQLELSELDRQTELACRMELKALQAQINPHFLFNTINTIAALIRTDPVAARHLLREFAFFYRRTLESEDELVRFARELEYVRAYLSFECARFGDRIRVSEEIDAEVLELEIPAFVVQPLVENAIQHGMPPNGGLNVRLTAHVHDATLLVKVIDDGRGIAPGDLPRVLEPGFGKGLGIALKNVDDRLKGHFGHGSGVKVRSEPGSGTEVTLLIVMEPAERGVALDA